MLGPFWLKYGRNKKMKSWGAVFTCATVCAIHLEIVKDLSTEAFLHALQHFAAHHGWPTMIISDNGMSFVGAENELRSILQEGKQDIEDFAVTHKLKFNTPLSPHQGGFFENMVKLTKKALRVIVGTWNEMSTVFAKVECIMNSRPLEKPSNNANDLQHRTPNHLFEDKVRRVQKICSEVLSNPRRRFFLMVAWRVVSNICTQDRTFIYATHLYYNLYYAI